jgi:hypothetical protein
VDEVVVAGSVVTTGSVVTGWQVVVGDAVGDAVDVVGTVVVVAVLSREDVPAFRCVLLLVFMVVVVDALGGLVEVARVRGSVDLVWAEPGGAEPGGAEPGGAELRRGASRCGELG